MRYCTKFGFYELNPFPGCNQIVVSNHAFINKAARGQGHGRKQQEDRLENIKALGYDYVVCTVKATTVAEIKNLVRTGWKQLDSFLNRETENTVQLWGKSIEHF